LIKKNEIITIKNIKMSFIESNEYNYEIISQNINSLTLQDEDKSLTINPFEETNKFRLEQSVLSPNMFHVANNTSTPEVKYNLFCVICSFFFV
jgi:hypothetical protein